MRRARPHGEIEPNAALSLLGRIASARRSLLMVNGYPILPAAGSAD